MDPKADVAAVGPKDQGGSEAAVASAPPHPEPEPEPVHARTPPSGKCKRVATLDDRDIDGVMLRVGSFNVHKLARAEALAQVVNAHGPFDVLALQEAPDSAGMLGGRLAGLCAEGGLLEGMAIAVERAADYGLSNVLLVRRGVTVLATAQFDLTPASNEMRTAVLATIAPPPPPPPGGVDTDPPSDGEIGPVTFVCTHLDAYTEANRLAQLTGLRAQLIAGGVDIGATPFFLVGDMNALCRSAFSTHSPSPSLHCRVQSAPV